MWSQRKLIALLLTMFHFTTGSKVRAKVENNQTAIIASNRYGKDVEEEVCKICNCKGKL